MLSDPRPFATNIIKILHRARHSTGAGFRREILSTDGEYDVLIFRVFRVHGNCPVKAPLLDGLEKPGPVRGALTEEYERRSVWSRRVRTIVRYVARVLGSYDRQVFPTHGEAHFDVFSVYRYMASVNVSANPCRIQSAEQVHDPRAIRPQTIAAVGLINRLNACALAQANEAPQSPTRGAHVFPLVVARVVPEESDLDQRNASLRGCLVDYGAVGIERIDQVGFRTDNFATEAHFGPGFHGGRKRLSHVSRI